MTAEELAGRQKAFDAALALARSKGKWMSAWVGGAVVAQPPGLPWLVERELGCFFFCLHPIIATWLSDLFFLAFFFSASKSRWR